MNYRCGARILLSISSARGTSGTVSLTRRKTSLPSLSSKIVVRMAMSSPPYPLLCSNPYCRMTSPACEAKNHLVHQPVGADRPTPEQQFRNDLWEEHLREEFATRDTSATLDTMVADAYVNLVLVPCSSLIGDRLFP